MSKALGNQLPERLLQLLNGNDLASHWSQTIPLVSIDDRGLPHFAILSYGEVVAAGPAEIRIGTYAGSTTTRNMQTRPPVGLLIVDGNSVYYLKGSAKDVSPPNSPIVRFDVAIEAVSVDDEPGSRITSGITFEMAQGKDAWVATAQQTIAALR